MTTLRKPISRRTNTPLGAGFGPDRCKRCVITIIPGNGRDVPDTLELRPERSRRSERITVADVYRLALQGRVLKARLEKARAKKAKLATVRERRRLDSAERRLRQPMP